MTNLQVVLAHLGMDHFIPTVLSGGSINQVYLLQNASQSYVLKLTGTDCTQSMLQAEADGLLTIHAAGSIRTPTIYQQDSIGDFAFLLMEYVPSTRHLDASFGTKFGRQLAALHQKTVPQYGYHSPNFIGSLPQPNRFHSSWVDFYISERLLPQWESASASGFFQSSHQRQFDHFTRMLASLLNEEKPSLLHGDLWNGNYLASITGDPVLIDPAVYFGHREIDLAMSLLFGGFPDSFYEGYREAFPLEKGWQERIPIYQLYYLLVHVNLFGSSYVPSCLDVIRQF